MACVACVADSECHQVAGEVGVGACGAERRYAASGEERRYAASGVERRYARDGGGTCRIYSELKVVQ